VYRIWLPTVVSTMHSVEPLGEPQPFVNVTKKASLKSSVKWMPVLALTSFLLCNFFIGRRVTNGALLVRHEEQEKPQVVDIATSNGLIDPASGQKQSPWPSQNPSSIPTDKPSSFPTNQPTWYKLNVPFYVYENPELNWVNATMDGKPYIPRPDEKHTDDYYMRQAALNHPMRTHDPEQAKLFFVPTLLNALLDQWAAHMWFGGKQLFCINGTEGCFTLNDQLQLFLMVNQALTESPWFQRSSGKDHVIVASHWMGRHMGSEFGAIHMCNTILFENDVPVPAWQYDRVRMPGFYIGRPCPPMSKTSDFAMIASMFFYDTEVNEEKRGNFKSRSDICEWLGSDHTRNITVGLCGRGIQCPTLAQTRYGFHVRGDTWGSNRLMDILMSYTIPLFTNEEQYKIVPPFYPWKEVSYSVNVTDHDSFFASIDDILSRPEAEYEEKIELIKANMHILDHTQPYQFDLHMVELARRLGLQT
jgi:hypothetical protein